MDSGVSVEASSDGCWLLSNSSGGPRILLREYDGQKAQPTEVILDSRTLQSTPERGARGGYDGAKRRKG
jgi:hypothetical protein